MSEELRDSLARRADRTDENIIADLRETNRQLRARAIAAEEKLAAANADIDRLNQMLRATGYGQGQIDSYAAECEARERAEEQLAAAEAALAQAQTVDARYFLALYDAWRAAKTNEECAHLLRMYCTDGKAFLAKYGHQRCLETN